MSVVESKLLARARKLFLQDVLDGLRSQPKSLPCKYFYDQTGSQLFDRICELDEYYLTRTELQIMKSVRRELAALLGPNAALVEYGSGSSLKTRILLDHLPRLAAYVPVDISRDHLRQTARELRGDYPQLTIKPVCADFTDHVPLPDLEAVERTIIYFPGSTIGNFEPPAARQLLRGMADLIGGRGGVLIGVDLLKDRAVLEAAYNDASGVTREFNLNLLHRINRELQGNLHVPSFEHVALFNPEKSRIEIYLESQRSQSAAIRGHQFDFDAGERIHTENSHKYSLAQFRELAASAGLRVQAVWCDPNNLFSVQYLTAV